MTGDLTAVPGGHYMADRAPDPEIGLRKEWVAAMRDWNRSGTDEQIIKAGERLLFAASFLIEHLDDKLGLNSTT